ncbi:MAG: LamG-like jellyroll fold domain-containing protein, partial [Candidatus Nanohaloarchaea archaeon]|nr:LamG-like jellyroll fold domain-containing protein [Candidatus Nanohaloarchaea archaeon]
IDAKGSDGFLDIYTGSWQSDIVSLDQDQWQMITTTYNGTTMITYKDGTEVNRTNSADISSGGQSGSKLGSTYNGGSKFYDGKLDEVRTYNSAINASEVKELYMRGGDGKFQGHYNQSFSLPSSELPDEITVESEDIGAGQTAWVNVSTTKGERNVFQLDSGDTVKNYPLNFSISGGNVTVKINMTTNTSKKSPVINRFDLWTKVGGTRTEKIETFQGGKPRSFMPNNSQVRIEVTGSYGNTPNLTVTDSNGTKQFDQKPLTNITGTPRLYRFNYTLNGSFGWYDLTITSKIVRKWDNVFYQARTWQDNFTDSSGNSYTFRRRLNVSEPGTDKRWFVPVDRNLDFDFEPDPDSIRVVAWNGSRMLEIPSQVYNTTDSGGGEINNGNIAFLSSLNKSETRDYYVVSAKSEYKKNYSTDLNTENLSNRNLTRISNSYYTTFFDHDTGGLMKDLENKFGTNGSLSGSEPMDFYPQLDAGSTIAARNEKNPAINVTSGAVLSRITVSGNIEGLSNYPYTMECTVYSKNTYMECEKNLTRTGSSDDWSELIFNGLKLSDGLWKSSAYRNSTNAINIKSLSDGNNPDTNALDFQMDWITFYNNDTSDAVAELWLNQSFDVTQSEELAILDQADEEFYKQTGIFSTVGVNIPVGSSFYTRTARMAYNGIRNYNVVNNTFNQLSNPVTIGKGSEETNDAEIP